MGNTIQKRKRRVNQLRAEIVDIERVIKGRNTGPRRLRKSTSHLEKRMQRIREVELPKAERNASKS